MPKIPEDDPFLEKALNRLIAKHEKLLSHNRAFFIKDYRWASEDFDNCLNLMYTSWRKRMYHNNDCEHIFKNLCERWYLSDLKNLHKQDSLSLEIAQDIKKLNMVGPEDNWAFITIGWNEQEVTPILMQKASANIASLKYFSSVQYVLEKHRENGIHHHTHFLVKFNEKLFKSKLIDWLYQTKGVKVICLGKNFIDIKGPLNKKKPYQTLELYENYVNGIKQEDKKKYIELDKKWRKTNNFLDIYTSESI